MVSNCARPTRAFGGRALREQRRLTGYPFPSYTGRGARTDGLVSDRPRGIVCMRHRYRCLDHKQKGHRFQ